MPQTPNHGYNVPNEGAQDWHVPLNKNFKQYDTDIEIRDEDANKGDYVPKQGAKFLATDTEAVYLGDGSEWTRQTSTGTAPRFKSLRVEGDIRAKGVGAPKGKFKRFEASTVGVGRVPSRPLDVRGRNNWDLDNGDGDVRIGNGNYRLAIGVALDGSDRGACNLRAKGGIERLKLGAGTSGHTVRIDQNVVSVVGDLKVSGTKNFVQTVDTSDGPKEVVYTATEAGTPHTEASGVARLEDGRAEIDLPEHFGWVTSDDEPIVVQVTPHAGEPVRPQVTERSTGRIVVEDLGDGPDSYEVSYTVKGTREGHADKQVVRDPDEARAAPAAPANAKGVVEEGD